MAMPIAPAATAAPTIALAPPVTIAAAAPALEMAAAVVVVEVGADFEPEEDDTAAVLEATDLAEAHDVAVAIVVPVAVAAVLTGTAAVAGATLGRSLFKILDSPFTRLVSMARNWDGTRPVGTSER